MKKIFYSVLCITLALFSCAGTPNASGGAEQIEEAAKERLQFPESEDAALNTEEPAEESAKAYEKKTAQKTEPALSAERASGADEAVQKMSAAERPAAKMHVSETVKMPPVLQKKHFAHAEKLTPAEIDELPDLDDSARSADTAQKSEEIEEPVVHDLEAPEPKKTVDSADEEAVPPEILNLLAMLEAPENEDAALPAQSESQQIDDEPASSETLPEEAHEDPIPPRPVPSRAMSVKKNQLIDVVYPGKGWIYQGNIDEDGNTDAQQRNFVFGGRKIGAESQTFTVSARNAGAFLLHFYKNDALTGSYIDDYLEVNVEDDAASLDSRVTAPDYALAVPPPAKITAETVKAEKARRAAKEQTAAEEADVPNAPPVLGKAPLPEKDADGSEKGDTMRAPKSTKILENAQTKTTADAAPVNPINDEDIRTSVTETELDNTSGKDGKMPELEAGRSEMPARMLEENALEAEMRSESRPPAQAELLQNDESETEDMTADDLLALAKTQYESKEYEKSFETLKKFFLQAHDKIDEGLLLQGAVLESPSPIRNIKNAIDSYDELVRSYPKSALRKEASKRSTYLKRFYINIR